MHYRSIQDLNLSVARGLARLPADIDLVVGIPRSGLLAANLVSLARNLPLADLEGFCAGRLLGAGRTRRRASFDQALEAFRHVLVVDDSISSGESMAEARRRLSALPTADGRRVTFCAVYGTQPRHAEADIVLEAVPHERVFEWNVMHHHLLSSCCVDIDGVLCADPTEAENDDGPRYLDFLARTPALLRPSRPIGHLVTSRLEKYRGPTEAWLAEKRITYGRLWMLDLPSAAERRRLGAHGSFKAEVFKSVDSPLFIESEEQQAITIARLAGKPVLSIETQTLIDPAMAEALGAVGAAERRKVVHLHRESHERGTLFTRVKRGMRRTLGDGAYTRLRSAAHNLAGTLSRRG